MQGQDRSATNDELKAILTGDAPGGSAALVRRAEEIAGLLAAGRDSGTEAGTAQIRAIFDEIRQIEAIWLRNGKEALHRLHLLKPKMAYRKARTPGIAPLVDALTPAVDLAVEAHDPDETRRRFNRLVEYCEAILAYHKAHTVQHGKGRR